MELDDYLVHASLKVVRSDFKKPGNRAISLGSGKDAMCHVSCILAFKNNEAMNFSATRVRYKDFLSKIVISKSCDFSKWIHHLASALSRPHNVFFLEGLQRWLGKYV